MECAAQSLGTRECEPNQPSHSLPGEVPEHAAKSCDETTFDLPSGRESQDRLRDAGGLAAVVYHPECLASTERNFRASAQPITGLVADEGRLCVCSYGQELRAESIRQRF